MYSTEEGRADLKRKELLSGILMLISTVVLGVFIWATVGRYGFSMPYVTIYALWFVLSVYFTKVYLFLTPRMRYGTVTAIKDFKETWYRRDKGNGGYGKYAGHIITECTLTIAFDSGKEGDFVFVYKGELKTLKVGDRVGVFRFLRMPVQAQTNR